MMAGILNRISEPDPDYRFRKISQKIHETLLDDESRILRLRAFLEVSRYRAYASARACACV
jgi:hypothetical protein